MAQTTRDTAIQIGVFVGFSIALTALVIIADAIDNLASGGRVIDPDWWLIPILATVVSAPAFVTSYVGYVFDRMLSDFGAGYIWYSCFGSVGPTVLLVFFDWSDGAYFTLPGINWQYAAVGIVIGAIYGCSVRFAIWR